jgi:hypothetical protein
MLRMTKRKQFRLKQAIQQRKQQGEKSAKRDQPFNELESNPANVLQTVTIARIQRQMLASEIGQVQGNRHLQSLVSLQRSGDPAQAGAIAGMEAKEQLLEHLSNELQGKPPKDKNAGQEAIKQAAKAALETKTGKQIQKKVKRFLFSTDGVPVSIMLGATSVAAMIANNTEVPSIPIPLSDNMELTIDVAGPINRPTGAMATFKLTF